MGYVKARGAQNTGNEKEALVRNQHTDNLRRISCPKWAHSLVLAWQEKC